MLESRDALFRRGLTMVRFNESGTKPVESQFVTISVNTKAISSIHPRGSKVGTDTFRETLSA